MKKSSSWIIALSTATLCSVFAQKTNTPAPTEAQDWLKASQYHQQKLTQSPFSAVDFTSIGPTVMSGRVVDIEVNPENHTEFYVAYATGGLWHTQDNGISFTSLMDDAPTQNIGDIAVDWTQGHLWVGTGENNASRSSYAGMGMLFSSDQGKTWVHKGLEVVHHVGRVVVHPTDPNTLWVAAAGRLYGPNPERGVYKTTDGGKSWKQVLYVSPTAGAIDLVMVPNEPQTLYAATWEKDRKAWHFEGSGAGSGIYKSVDGGEKWTLVTTPKSGFPTGAGVGRIGLAAYDKDLIYAVLDNQFHQEKKEPSGPKSGALTKDDFKSMTVAEFAALADGRLNEYLKANGFQEKYRAPNVKQLVASGSVKPADLALYLEDANAMLFDTPVIGAEVYASRDGGKSWSKQNKQPIEDLFYSYGYYFAQIRVAPSDPNRIVLAGVPLIQSVDGGKTYTAIDKDNVHSDHHALWINPKNPDHMINGNDGGVNITYDSGAHWMKNNTPAVGQFYAINVDNQTPYHVYGGLQDNGVWSAPHTTRVNESWQDSGAYPWKRILGGDGMQVEIDPRNPNTVFTGFQFGNYFRVDRTKGKNTPIQPKHTLGEAPFRFNWESPIRLSKHHPDILYFGSNHLHRSLDQGTTWETISKDLTQGGRKGNVAFGTLTVIEESPAAFGQIWTGSDDGLVSYTPDGGHTWSLKNKDLPQNLWVASIEASAHDSKRVILALNNYRNDDFTPYVYVSEDAGATWKSSIKGLPLGAVNVVIEDPQHPHLLYAGTDVGVFASLDLGANWHPLGKDLPKVAVHDLVVQAEAHHLVIATHGRSVYIADIADLQKMTPSVQKTTLSWLATPKVKHSARWGAAWGSWSAPNTPSQTLSFFSKNSGTANFEVTHSNGTLVYAHEVSLNKGLNRLDFGLAFSEKGAAAYLKKVKTELKKAADGQIYLPKGNYTLTLKSADAQIQTPWAIE